MIQALLISFLAGIGGLWLATKFVPGVSFSGPLTSLLIAGLILGIIIAVARPLLNFISVLLRLAVLALIVFGSVWALSIAFPAVAIGGLGALLWTTAIITGIVFVLSLFK